MTRSSSVSYQDGLVARRPDDCRNVVASVNANELRMEALGRGHYPGKRLPRGVMPGLKSIGFFSAEREQHWGTGWHYNEGIEICYIENGQIDFMTDDAVYPLNAGDVTFTRPWQRHCLGDPYVATSRLHWLMLDLGVRRPGDPWRWPKWIVMCPEDKERLTRDFLDLHNPILSSSPDLDRCFRRIGELVAGYRSGASLSLLVVLVNEVFALLLDQLRESVESENRSRELCLRLVGRFWQDLIGRPEELASCWSLSELASRCGLGVTQFALHTRTLKNLPPMHFLRQCRLQWASRLLLEEPARSITQIALDCGFSSGQHFATTFRQHFRCAPQVYRIKNGT